VENYWSGCFRSYYDEENAMTKFKNLYVSRNSRMKDTLNPILEPIQHLIGKRFIDITTKKYYKFIGILTDNDDHYYAFYHKENGLYMISCVVSFEYTDFELVE